jgi:hypothetical protein
MLAVVLSVYPDLLRRSLRRLSTNNLSVPGRHSYTIYLVRVGSMVTKTTPQR